MLTPTIVGKYTMTIKMTNAYTAHFPSLPTEIYGSPFTVFVYPCVFDPYRCYSDVPLSNIPAKIANVAYNYKINFVDLYGNQHFQTMINENLTVIVRADYENHNDWLSPINVADLTDWQTIYSTSILGTASDKNDGTMTGSVTI